MSSKESAKPPFSSHVAATARLLLRPCHTLCSRVSAGLSQACLVGWAGVGVSTAPSITGAFGRRPSPSSATTRPTGAVADSSRSACAYIASACPVAPPSECVWRRATSPTSSTRRATPQASRRKHSTSHSNCTPHTHTLHERNGRCTLGCVSGTTNQHTTCRLTRRLCCRLLGCVQLPAASHRVPRHRLVRPYRPQPRLAPLRPHHIHTQARMAGLRRGGPLQVAQRTYQLQHRRQRRSAG